MKYNKSWCGKEKGTLTNGLYCCEYHDLEALTKTANPSIHSPDRERDEAISQFGEEKTFQGKYPINFPTPTLSKENKVVDKKFFQDINNVVLPHEAMKLIKVKHDFILKEDLDNFIYFWIKETIDKDWFNWESLTLKDKNAEIMLFTEEEKERFKVVSRILFVSFLTGVFKVGLENFNPKQNEGVKDDGGF